MSKSKRRVDRGATATGDGSSRPAQSARPSARDQVREKIERENRRRREQRVIMLVAAAVVLALVGGGMGIQLYRSRKAPDPVAVDTVARLNAVVPPRTGQPLVLGDPSAPVTVSLYEDFHCPHCAEFEQRYGSVLTDAQVAGRIKIELYPMAFIDDGSARASNAMACAAEAGFPQTYYLALFGNPTLEWNTDQLVSLAATAGGTATPAFTSCVTGGTHARWVDSINTAANANGVRSTPTMFVDGQPVDISTLTVATLKDKLGTGPA